MPFAPHEIENKRFVMAMRGYQTEEVDAFLRAVAADVRALLEQLEAASPGRLVSDLERIMSTAREQAEREAAELRATAIAEGAAIREAAELEAEACFDEIATQAEALHRLETALWARMHALEHVVVEARQTLSHTASLYPVDGRANGEGPNRGEETNVEDEIPAR